MKMSTGSAALLLAFTLAAPFTAFADRPDQPGNPSDGGLTGAIFTTLPGCSVVNGNTQYASREDVYMSGGPQNGANKASLPDGTYYVKVTEPGGLLLGTSVGAADERPFTVTGGVVDCDQLWAILIKASDGSQGYDRTSNPGGEYKLWASTSPTFENSASKTDNFKVVEPDPVIDAQLDVIKFYDANANGVNDDNADITGWKVVVAHADHTHLDYIRFTPASLTLDPHDYVVWEATALESNWMATTSKSVDVTLAAGDEKKVEFGNLCLGGGNGHTLGFWSNKNGQALVDSGDMAMLNGLNLRNGNGSNFDPVVYLPFRNWLLSATATNMAYMLSAQMAATSLSVNNGHVSAGALIYAPGTTSANFLGFASVGAVIAEANASLGANGYTVASGPVRSYQEALKNALDRANNNLNFVQGSACPFSF